MSYLVNDVFPAGVVLPYAGSTAPTGWLLCDGSAIDRAQYKRLFDTISTTYGTGNGSTTFNLPDLRGRTPAGKDNMGGTAANRLSATVTGTTLGATGGMETHQLTTLQLPAHAHGQQGTFSSGLQSSDHSHNFATGGINANHYHGGSTDTQGTHTHTINTTADGGFNTGRVNEADRTARLTTATTNSAGAHAHNFNTGYVSNDHGHSGTTYGMNSSHYHDINISGNTGNTGSGESHNNTQPTIILNYIIKL